MCSPPPPLLPLAHSRALAASSHLRLRPPLTPPPRYYPPPKHSKAQSHRPGSPKWPSSSAPPLLPPLGSRPRISRNRLFCPPPPPHRQSKYSAFHPIFFLHHSNVDRLYQAYLEAHPDSAQEFRSYEDAVLSLRLSRRDHKWKAPLRPFDKGLMATRHAGSDSALLMPEECSAVDTAALFGYKYDSTPRVQRRGQRLQEARTLVLLRNASKIKAGEHSYSPHVFVLPRAEASGWAGPGADPNQWALHPAFAGHATLFAGKGYDCANCEAFPYVSMTVDITDAMRAQRLSRTTVGVRIFVHGAQRNHHTFEPIFPRSRRALDTSHR